MKRDEAIDNFEKYKNMIIGELKETPESDESFIRQL